MTSLVRCSSYQIDSNDPGEDRVVVRLSPDMDIFAVIDGHGGGGTNYTLILPDLLLSIFTNELIMYRWLGVASTLCAEYLINIIESKRDVIISHKMQPSIVSDILCDAFIHADALILDECKARSDAVDPSGNLATRFAPFKAGCCALLLVIVDLIAYVVHVGYCIFFRIFLALILNIFVFKLILRL
jgi:hypothetical protein